MGITNNEEQLELIQTLTKALPILRASINISQNDLAKYIGISRQTYCAIELEKRRMSWNTFLSLFLFFISNEATNTLLKTKKDSLHRYMHSCNMNQPKLYSILIRD